MRCLVFSFTHHNIDWLNVVIIINQLRGLTLDLLIKLILYYFYLAIIWIYACEMLPLNSYYWETGDWDRGFVLGLVWVFNMSRGYNHPMLPLGTEITKKRIHNQAGYRITRLSPSSYVLPKCQTLHWPGQPVFFNKEKKMAISAGAAVSAAAKKALWNKCHAKVEYDFAKIDQLQISLPCQT